MLPYSSYSTFVSCRHVTSTARYHINLAHALGAVAAVLRRLVVVALLCACCLVAVFRLAGMASWQWPQVQR